MPRIRTLKPEALQHRKVGRLSDRAFRLWVAMLTQADDEGRVVAEPDQLRVIAFGYQPRTKAADVARALAEIAAAGLIRLYRVQTVRYADFPSWLDHQKVDHPTRSKLPAYEDGAPIGADGDVRFLTPGSERPPNEYSPNPREPSRTFVGDRKGSDQGSEGSEGSVSVIAAAAANGLHWPTAEALVALYNTESPDEAPAVETLSGARRKKAEEYLRLFPAEAWWRETFAQMRRSPFLRGRVHREGRKPFLADFDWLLMKGRDGTENAVKVHDGKYRDL